MPAVTGAMPNGAALAADGVVRKRRRNSGEDGPHPVDVHVGSRLRLRRMTLGMSQSVLGGHVGLTFQQIQKYERGANRVGASRLYEFSEVLGVPVSYFFDEMPKSDSAGAARKTANLPSAGTGKDELRALSAYLGIGSPEIQKSLYKLMRSLDGRAPD